MSWFDHLKAAEIAIGLMLTVFGVGSGGFGWMHGRLKATVRASTAPIGAAQAEAARRIDDLGHGQQAMSADIGRLEARLKDVERTVAGLPSREDIHALIVKMTRLEGRMDQLDERMRPVALSIERIETWMMGRGASEGGRRGP